VVSVARWCVRATHRATAGQLKLVVGSATHKSGCPRRQAPPSTQQALRRATLRAPRHTTHAAHTHRRSHAPGAQLAAHLRKAGLSSAGRLASRLFTCRSSSCGCAATRPACVCGVGVFVCVCVCVCVCVWGGGGAKTAPSLAIAARLVACADSILPPPPPPNTHSVAAHAASHASHLAAAPCTCRHAVHVLFDDRQLAAQHLDRRVQRCQVRRDCVTVACCVALRGVAWRCVAC
jgi:hypothetical protein